MKLHHYLWVVAAACMLLPGCSNEDLSDHAAAPVFIPGNSEVFHLCRVMYLDKEPLFIDSSWIPLSRYPDFDEIYVEPQWTKTAIWTKWGCSVSHVGNWRKTMAHPIFRGSTLKTTTLPA